MFALVAVTVSAVIAILVETVIYYSRYLHIPTIKGWIPFFTHPNLITLDSNKMAERITDLRIQWRKEEFFKNGIFKVWVGPFPVVLVTQPEIAKQVLNNSHSKSTVYRQMEFFFGQGLLTSRGNHHRYHRKIAAKGFRVQNLTASISSAEESARKFVEEIKLKSTNGRIDKLTDHLSRLILEPFFSSVFNMDFNTKIGKETADQLSRVIKCFTTLFLNCVTKPYFDRVKNFSTIGKEYDELIKNVVGPLVQEVIKTKMSQESKLGDSTIDFMVGEYLSSDGKFSLQDLKDEINNFLIAGVETTFTTIRWVFETLGNYEDEQEKVWQELKEIFEDETNREMTSDDLKKMVYLEAVIKETMRMYTPIWLIGRQIDNPFVATALDGTQYVIKEGTEVALLLDDMHKMENVFEDPLKFNPSRFIDPVVVNSRHPYAFIPFAAGNRVCLGNKYAIIQLKAIFATILRTYKFKSLNDLSKMKPLTAFSVYPAEEQRIQFTLRSQLTRFKWSKCNSRLMAEG